MNKQGFAKLGVLAVIAAQIFVAASASASTALKQVQVSNGSQVDLLFDGKVSKNQIKTEFFNDIIQLSLTDVSVYPAKISSVNGGVLTKIFAYQYAPKLVRCRLSVKGKAEAYKDKIALEFSGPNGRMLTVRLGGAVAATRTSKTSYHSNEDNEEAALLERVMKAPVPQGAVPAVTAVPANAQPAKITDRIVEKAAAPVPAEGSSYSDFESKPLNLGRAESHNLGQVRNNVPSPLGVLVKFSLVVALFGLCAFAAKKLWKGKGGSDNKFIGALGKFARTSLGVGDPKMSIEMVSSHHFGPKRSIAVVKVAGRTLVVGITEQSINLIAQLSSEEDTLNSLAELDNPPLDAPTGVTSNGVGATAAGPAVFSQSFAKNLAQSFSKTLQSESVKPAVAKAPAPRTDVRVTSYGSGMGGTGVGNVTANARPAGNSGYSAQAAAGLSGVRAQIRSKLEGLKEI